MLPDGPVEPGTPVEQVPVPGQEAAALFRTAMSDAAAAATGRPPTDPAPDAVVWNDGVDALLVLLGSVVVETDDGVVTVGIDVGCDQLQADTGEPRARVEVDLVIGTDERPTGLLVAAPRPRGPAVVVDRWSDALVALAWQALLDTAAGLSAATGADIDGTALVPTSWTASGRGFAVGPQARHEIDRRRARARRSAPDVRR